MEVTEGYLERKLEGGKIWNISEPKNRRKEGRKEGVKRETA